MFVVLNKRVNFKLFKTFLKLIHTKNFQKQSFTVKWEYVFSVQLNNLKLAALIVKIKRIR